jgi:hypothetical protein
MKTTARLGLTLIAGGALAGCHHRQQEPVYTAPTETVATTTTTTSNPMPDTMGSGMSGTSNTSTSTTTMSTERRENAGGGRGMRGERRELHQAMASIERARRELERSGNEFGGRKSQAMKATSEALHELRLASGQEAREARGGMEGTREERVEGRELHLALADLERARADMEHAKHDFNGRRKETIEAVDAAIRELRQAAEYEK